MEKWGHCCRRRVVVVVAMSNCRGRGTDLTRLVAGIDS
jgi:hypothetical protein